jgi:hypothetical protein
MAARIEIAALHIALAGTASLRARGVTLGAADPGASRWQLAIGSLSAAGPGWTSGELRVEATLARDGAELDVAGTAYLAGTRLLAFTAVRDATGTFLRLEVPRVRIGQGGIPAEALFAPLPDRIASPSGTLEAGAVLALSETREARAWLAIEEGAVEFAGIGLSGISTRLSFESLDPPVTLPGQQLRIDRIDAGLPLGPFEALFALRAGPELAVRRASLGVAGGRLVTRPFALDPLRPEGVVEATVDGIDLETLVSQLAVEGLAATGRLDGEARLAIDPEGGIVAETVRLSAQGGGILRYRGEAAARTGDPRLGLLYRVLEDFHYRRLVAELEGPLAGELGVRLTLEGANPAVYGGHPVALDMRFEGPLGRILQQGLRGYRLPEALGERLRERLR